MLDGEFCPEASGFAVGACLKQHEDKLSNECKAYISVHDNCLEDIKYVF